MSIWTCPKFGYLIKSSKLNKQQILHASKLKGLADDNFRFDKNGRKFPKWEENTVGKGEIARFEQYLFFPLCFQEACTADP